MDNRRVGFVEEILGLASDADVETDVATVVFSYSYT